MEDKSSSKTTVTRPKSKLRRNFQIQCHNNAFEAKDFFRYHDWYEEFDFDKLYDDAPFSHDYGKGEGNRLYIYAAYMILPDITNNAQFYIAAEHFLDKKEMKLLSPYCQCDYCNMNMIKQFAYALISNDVFKHCIKHQKQIQCVVKKTIVYYNTYVKK